MAAPTLVSTTTTDFGVAGTTYGVVMPATVDVGDLLVVLLCIDDVQVWGAMPTGWNRLVRNGFENPGEVIAWKIADGTEDGTTVNFTSDQSRKGTVHVFRITGHRATNPLFAGVTGAYQASGRIGAIQPFGAADMLWLAYASISSTSSILTGAAAPSGYSALTTSGSAANDHAQLVSASKQATGVEVEGVSAAWDTNTFGVRYGLIGIFASGTPDFPSDISDILQVHSINEYYGDFSGADTTAHAVSISPRKGSYLVAFVCMDSGNPTSITTPSGWTQRFHFDDTTVVHALYVKRATGEETEVDFVTSNTQRGSVWIWEYQNARGLLGVLTWTSNDFQRPPITSYCRPDGIYVPVHYIRSKDNGNFSWHGDVAANGVLGQSSSNTGAFQSVVRQDPRSPMENDDGVVPEFPGINYEGPNNAGTLHFCFYVIPEFVDASISGTVSLDGSPVEGAEVYAHDTRGNRIFGPAVTDVNGDYSLGVIDGYTYDVQVEYEDGGQKYNALSAWEVSPV